MTTLKGPCARWIRMLVVTLSMLTSVGAASVQAAEPLNLGLLRQARLFNTPGETIKPIEGTEIVEGTIVHDSLVRHYFLIRPVAVPRGAPALLLLHALGLDARRMANLTGAGRLAALYGVSIYLPDSVGNQWHDDSAKTGPDDVGFLEALLRREIAVQGLDANRIYVAGYSNGGFMAERMACDKRELFAGLAMIASTLRPALEARCAGTQQMPMLQFNGLADTVVPYKGTRDFSSAPASFAYWGLKNGCSPVAEDTALPDLASDDGTRITMSRYPGCIASEVRLYTITGGGHTWPGSTDTRTIGATSLDIDATLELWQVLTAYSRLPSP